MAEVATARFSGKNSLASQGSKKLRARMPPYARALLQALRFSEPNPEYLGRLDDPQWLRLLELADRTQLTLLLPHIGGEHLPLWVQERVHRNQLNNNVRFSRLQASLRDINKSFRSKSIDFVVLKGFTNVGHFIPDPKVRSQGDLDLWCQPKVVSKARDALVDVGYRSVGKSKGRHLDPMIREASWEWTGDYFAPDLPIPVDLHYRLWDASTEHIAGPAEDAIWRRCVPAGVSGCGILQQLNLTDALAFASLHVLMHLLHGDVRLQRVWELAFFLQKHSGDEAFWRYWKGLYTDEERRMQVIPLALAAEWFNCTLPDSVIAEIKSLPKGILLWLERYGASPLGSLFSTNFFAANKDELLLNLCLLHSPRSKLKVVGRRLFPIHAVGDAYTEHGKGDGRLSRSSRHNVAKWRRFFHHMAVLPLVCWRLILWWWRCNRRRA